MTQRPLFQEALIKSEGKQGSIVQASTASNGQTASELLTCEQQSMEVSLSSLGMEQISD